MDDLILIYKIQTRLKENLQSIGDAMMSLIHTAVSSNINPFDYLNALQLYSSNIQAAPEKWLPWNYQDTLLKLTTSTAPEDTS